MPNNYQNQRDAIYIEKTRALLEEMPEFCKLFFRGIEHNTTAMTRYSYALDLKTFFHFMCAQIDEFSGLNIVELTYDSLNALQPEHIEEFMSYVSHYRNAESQKAIQNHEHAKLRKLSSLRAFLKYFYKKKKIVENVASLVDSPKLHSKAIVRLEANETATLLDIAESGQGLSKQQKRFHNLTQWRDAAIISLFLGTGIRISELVGLNIDDVNFLEQSFRITRKGGAQVILYYSDEVAAALNDYLLQRQKIQPVQEDENALFLSIQRRRISTRAVQNLVKKYAKAAVPLKSISPHKLRSTYGTMLYHETGDIYLVADVLGHSDVNTTKKHYAAQSDANRRKAARSVKLRDD